MTLPVFIKELKALRGKYKVMGNGRIRASERVGYCPIVGVAKLKGYRGNNYANGAAHLALRDGSRDKIIMAADNYRNSALRKKLLSALALKERKR